MHHKIGEDWNALCSKLTFAVPKWYSNFYKIVKWKNACLITQVLNVETFPQFQFRIIFCYKIDYSNDQFSLINNHMNQCSPHTNLARGRRMQMTGTSVSFLPVRVFTQQLFKKSQIQTESRNIGTSHMHSQTLSQVVAGRPWSSCIMS